MAKAPAFQLYVRRWLCSKTIARMTGDQVKAFLYMLCEAWLEEPRATLPDDEYELMGYARMDKDKWETNKNQILKAFHKGEEGRLFNETLMEVSGNKAKHEESGSKGGKKSQANRKETSSELQGKCNTESESDID